MTTLEANLQALIHRLSECPPDFLRAKRTDTEKVQTEALVADVMIHLGADPLTIIGGESTPPRLQNTAPQYQTLVQIGCWLLADAFFANKSNLVEPAYRWLIDDLARLSPLVPAEKFVTDPDRREELVRRLLRHLGIKVAGETIAQGEDRLASLDSVELNRVLKETEEEQKRRKKVMDALRKRAAEEAAAKITRE